MTKKEKIEKFIEKYNGYLITSLVCKRRVLEKRLERRKK